MTASPPAIAPLRECTNCGGQGRTTRESADGQYGCALCLWCDGSGRMTLREFRAWLDDQAEKTPSADLSEAELRGLFDQEETDPNKPPAASHRTEIGSQRPR